jgi:hypothetical protein
VQGKTETRGQINMLIYIDASSIILRFLDSEIRNNVIVRDESL